VKRTVQTLQVGLQDALPLEVPAGVDLLLLLGRGTPAELPALRERLQAYPGEGPVVVGLPLAGGGHQWLYRGLTLRLPEENRRQFLAALWPELYADAPRPWKADRATRRAALDYLLDFDAPVWLPEAPAAEARSLVYLLHQAFVEPGLLQPVKRSGNSALYEWRQGTAHRPEGRLFAELLQRLFHSPATTLGEHLAWLGEPPRGLRGVPAWLYLTAALRCHSGDVRLAGQHGEPVPLTREALLQALRRPTAWNLEYRPAEPHEYAFTASLHRLFGGPEPDRALDPWEAARYAMFGWWDRLPDWTRRHAEGHSPNALALVQLCETQRSTPARPLLSRELPQAFRSAGIPRTEDQSFLLDRLESARLELEGHLQGQFDRMATRLYTLFTGTPGDPAISRQWLERGCRDWLAGVPPRSAQSHELSPWTLGLRQAITSEEAVERRWFEELPGRLELPPIAQWSTDLTTVFLARVARARLELELWTVLRTLPLEPQVEARQAQMGEWIRQTLQSVGLPAARAEKILFDLLETLYAQEAQA